MSSSDKLKQVARRFLLTLSDRDTQTFLEAMENPPELSEALIELFRKEVLNPREQLRTLLQRLQQALIKAEDTEDPAELMNLFVELFLLTERMKSNYWSRVSPDKINNSLKIQQKSYRRCLKTIAMMIPNQLDSIDDEDFEDGAGAGIIHELLNAIAQAQRIRGYRDNLPGGED